MKRFWKENVIIDIEVEGVFKKFVKGFLVEKVVDDILFLVVEVGMF